jgi:AraC-like DNA-binding protein
MPIFMDRHDVSESDTAESVAQLYQKDLKIQHKYGCRGLTYWFDDTRKTAFCLVEAPNKNAIIEMHKHAHGEVPHQIIKVDATIVESFLSRIEDPEKAQNTTLKSFNGNIVQQNEEIKVEDFEKNIGMSKSALYREMIRLTGKSPNVFLLHFGLRKSLQMLLKQKGNISEVAFDSGFNSLSYYAKCFRKKYGIIPFELMQQ